VDKKQPTPGEWAMIGGGAVALLASFLDFAGDTSAWGKGAFPIATLIPVYAIAAAIVVALHRFAGVDLPDRVLGFSWNQIYLVLGFFAALMALFWLVTAEDTGVGLFLLLLSSIAVTTGAVLVEKETPQPGTLG
jgi:hypothetical protein